MSAAGPTPASLAIASYSSPNSSPQYERQRRVEPSASIAASSSAESALPSAKISLASAMRDSWSQQHDAISYNMAEVSCSTIRGGL